MLVDHEKSLLNWATLVDSVAKPTVPVEFVSSVEFLYPGKSITLEVSALSKDELQTIGSIDSTSLSNIRLHYDLEKISTVVSGISESYLGRLV